MFLAFKSITVRGSKSRSVLVIQNKLKSHLTVFIHWLYSFISKYFPSPEV